MKKYRVIIVVISLLLLLCQSENIISALSFDTKIAYAESPEWGWRMENGTEVSFIVNTSLQSRRLTSNQFTNIYHIYFPNLDGYIKEKWCGKRDNALCEIRYVGIWLHDGTKIDNIIPEKMEY